MAGIGFLLKKLVRRDDLTGIASAYTHSTLISSGAWVFTIVALSIAYMLSSGDPHAEPFLNFQAALFYNFAFSLIFTAPIHMVATRYIAECIYKKDITNIGSSLVNSLGLVVVTQSIPVIWFYFFYLKLSMVFKLLALLNFFLLSSVWVLNIYLTALKNYTSTTRIFAIGMFIVFVLVMWLMRGYNEIGILFGFNAGLAFIVFSLIGEVLAEYNYRPFGRDDFFAAFKKFYDLALAGTFYSAAVWSDKLVMAYAPEATHLSSGFRVYFEYNEAFFVAYIIMIPAIAMFILNVETHFFERYRKFYNDILAGAPYHRIDSNHQSIVESLRENGRNMAIMQGCVCIFAIVFAHKLFGFLHLSYGQISMFHIAVLGSYFHTLALFELIILSYFECWRAALWIQVFFCAANIILTFISMNAGFEFYGYGYFLSALLTFILASAALYNYVRQLPYGEFVFNNILHRRKFLEQAGGNIGLK